MYIQFKCTKQCHASTACVGFCQFVSACFESFALGPDKLKNDGNNQTMLAAIWVFIFHFSTWHFESFELFLSFVREQYIAKASKIVVDITTILGQIVYYKCQRYHWEQSQRTL